MYGKNFLNRVDIVIGRILSGWRIFVSQLEIFSITENRVDLANAVYFYTKEENYYYFHCGTSLKYLFLTDDLNQLDTRLFDKYVSVYKYICIRLGLGKISVYGTRKSPLLFCECVAQRWGTLTARWCTPSRDTAPFHITVVLNCAAT